MNIRFGDCHKMLPQCPYRVNSDWSLAQTENVKCPSYLNCFNKGVAVFISCLEIGLKLENIPFLNLKGNQSIECVGMISECIVMLVYILNYEGTRVAFAGNPHAVIKTC